MPVRRALQTLTTCVELAVFLWRRKRPAPQSPAPEPDAHGGAPAEQKGIVAVARDISGEDVSTEHTQTVSFGLDGQDYEIDLSNGKAAELREVFGRYIAAGRRAGRQTRTGSTAPAGPRTRQPATADGHDAAAIREWARAHGHQVSDRGPIPVKVRQAFDTRRRGRAG